PPHIRERPGSRRHAGRRPRTRAFASSGEPGQGSVGVSSRRARSSLRTRTTTNHRIAAAITPTTSLDSTPLHRSSTGSIAGPNANPSPIHRPFQISEPTRVYSENGHSRIRSIPAGMEMKERTSGTHRPKNTAAPPQRAKNASALSKSAVSSSGTLTKIHLVRSRPSSAPSPYQIQAPTRLPSVAATIAHHTFIRPSQARNPAPGSTASEGIGGKNVSISTARPTPTSPIVVINDSTQPMNPSYSAAGATTPRAMAGSMGEEAPLVDQIQGSHAP